MVGLQLNVSIVAIKQYAIYVRILRFQGRSRPIFANNRYAIYQVQYRMTCKSVAISAQALERKERYRRFVVPAPPYYNGPLDP
jgi:hypothetical protein